MNKIWHKAFSMIQSAGIKNWFPQSINRLYMFNLLFLSVTRFFLIITVEQNMHDKNKDTKSFTELRKYLLNGYFFDSIAKSRI